MNENPYGDVAVGVAVVLAFLPRHIPRIHLLRVLHNGVVVQPHSIWEVAWTLKGVIVISSGKGELAVPRIARHRQGSGTSVMRESSVIRNAHVRVAVVAM